MTPPSKVRFRVILMHLYRFGLRGSKVGQDHNSHQTIKNLVISQDFLYIGSL